MGGLSRRTARTAAPPESRADPSHDWPAGGGVNAKSVGLGVVFVVLLSLLVQYVDGILNGTLTFHLIPAPGVIVLFFVLIWLVNTPLRAIAPRRALTTPELLVVYTMMAVGLTGPSIGLAQVLVPALAAPVYYASPANKFAEIFRLDTAEMLPAWLVPKDYDAVKGLFSRDSLDPVDWGAVAQTWTGPLVVWGLWIFAFYFVYVCLMSIVRRPWVEKEQLVFAYNVVPERMAEVPDSPNEVLAPFWKSKVMWAGFAFPFTYHMLANLYIVSPVFPQLPTQIRLEPLLTEFPWNGIGVLTIYVSLHAIALGMLLTEEFLFSLWFFFVVNKVLAISLFAFGLSETYSDFNSPAMSNQGNGAFVAYFLILLWSMRAHLRLVAGRAVRFRVGEDEAGEPMTYRAAVWGLFLGMAYLVGFLGFAGANPFWAFVVVGLILVYWIVLTRLVAEAGLYMAQGPGTVHDLVAKVAGTSVMSTQTWTILGFFKSIFLMWYTIMPAYILGGYKLALRHRIHPRRLVYAMLLAMVVSIVTGFCLTLWFDYTYGALNLSAWKARDLASEPFQSIRNTYDTPAPPQYRDVAVMGVGAAVTLFLSVMRMSFTWWPLHPLGYLASNLYVIHFFWIYFFIAWVLVKGITRYGGPPMLRRVRPFFIGMILGAFSAAGVWWILDYFYYVTVHWVFAP